MENELYEYLNTEELDENLDGTDPAQPDGNDGKPEGDTDNKGDEKLFTQADIEKIIGERLARDRKKREEEAEKQRLLDEAKYKDLYEKSEQEKEALLGEIKKGEIDRLKTELVVGAGYDADKVDFIKRKMNGDDEESLKAELEEMKQFFPPTPAFVDPSLSNGHRHKPAPVKDSEYGKSLYDQIKRK